MNQQELKEYLEYCPITGVFLRISKAKQWSIAGSLQAKGYIHICINYKIYLAHRLAFLYMTGRLPEHHVDHINGIRNDNSWANLRDVPRALNAKNRAKSRNNPSGINGVTSQGASGKWRAVIRVNRKAIHLGYFTELTDAVTARKVAEKLYGFHPNHGRDY